MTSLVGAALSSGIALINACPVPEVIGWALVGFAIGAVIDIVLLVIASWM